MRFIPVLIFLGLLSHVHAANLDARILEDHSGNPLASVSVRVAKPSERRLIADIDTDSAGRVHLPGVAPGEYRIELSKPNYQGLTVTLHLTDESPLPPQVFRLVRGASIAGRATDAQGQPINGGYVYAMPKPADGDSFRPAPLGLYSAPFQIPTDASGHFRLYNLPPGEYAVALAWGATRQTAAQSGGSRALRGIGTGVVLYPNNSSPTLFIITGGEQYEVNFVISPSALASISGKISRELKPNEGRFWLTLIAPGMPGLAFGAAQTQPDGAFRFEGIPPGTYDVVASGPSRGYGGGGGILEPQPVFGKMRVTMAGQNLENLVLAVEDGRSATFALRAAGISCPASAHLTLSPIEDWGTVLQRTLDVTSKPQTLDHLAPTQYRVIADVSDKTCYAPASVIDLTGAGTNSLELTLAPGGAIQGHLAATAKPGEYLVALIDPDFASLTPQIAFPDTNGAFEFKGLHPGRYRIAAEPVSERNQSRWTSTQSRMSEVTVAAGAAATVDLPLPAAAKVP